MGGLQTSIAPALLIACTRIFNIDLDHSHQEERQREEEVEKAKQNQDRVKAGINRLDIVEVFVGSDRRKSREKR